MSVPHTGRCPERRLLWVPEQDLLASVRCCPLPAWPSGHVFAHSDRLSAQAHPPQALHAHSSLRPARDPQDPTVPGPWSVVTDDA